MVVKPVYKQFLERFFSKTRKEIFKIKIAAMDEYLWKFITNKYMHMHVFVYICFADTPIRIVTWLFSLLLCSMLLSNDVDYVVR